MKSFDRQSFFLALLLVMFCAGCSQTSGRGTPASLLLRLGRGNVGTGETIAGPPASSTIPPYYQEVGGGFRKQYYGSRANIGNAFNGHAPHRFSPQW